MRSVAVRAAALALALVLGGCSSASFHINALGIRFSVIVQPHDVRARL
jgi:hypothetical protein